MTPEEFKQARITLGLTQQQMADMLDSDRHAVRKTEQDASTSTYRKPAPRMVRLMKAYLSGYRPDDWPSS